MMVPQRAALSRWRFFVGGWGAGGGGAPGICSSKAILPLYHDVVWCQCGQTRYHSNMRVAICTESYPPTISGVAVFVSKAAHELKARGHEVTILAPSAKGKSYREMQDGILVHRIRSIPSPFRRNMRYVVGQQLAISTILRKFQPDIIHIQDLGGSSAAGIRWGRRHSVPVVGTRHFAVTLAAAYFPLGKLFPEDALHMVIDAYVHDFYEACTVVTCPTETVRHSMMTSGFKGRIEVLSNGVDIPPRSNLSVRRKNDPPIVLTVSRIDVDKNIPLLLEAAPLVHAKRPVQFVIVGDGTVLRDCRKFVRDNDLSGFVRFTGALKPNSAMLRNWYDRANVMAIPSLIETQSITTMEAMAAALPVVAPRAGALPELVKDGETGYLVPIPTAAHFAQTILQALDNPAEAEALGTKGRSFVERFHERTHCIDGLVRLYERTIAGEFTPNRS